MLQMFGLRYIFLILLRRLLWLPFYIREFICSKEDSYFVFLFSFRSSRPEVFSKKGVLKNFTILRGKHLCQSLHWKRQKGTGVFLSILWNFKNTFLYRKPPLIRFDVHFLFSLSKTLNENAHLHFFINDKQGPNNNVI